MYIYCPYKLIVFQIYSLQILSLIKVFIFLKNKTVKMFEICQNMWYNIVV